MLLNNFEFKEDASERIHNELPSNYSSWLEFYDSIPAEHKEVSVLRTTYRGAAYYAGREKPKEYIIQREYLLARLAEELLPLRPASRDFVDGLVVQLHLRDGHPSEEQLNYTRKLFHLAPREQ